MQKRALIVVNLAGFLNFLWNDIKTLQQIGYDVSVAMNARMVDGSEAIEISKLNELGIKHYQIDFDTKSPITKANLLAFKQLKKVLKNDYDLIHCHTPIVGILTRMLANKYRKSGTRVIYTTHGFTFTDRSSKKVWLMYYTLELIMSRFCDAIITINHEDYNNAKKMHCKNVYIIPSVGIDISRFENVQIDRGKYRESLGVSPQDTMVLAVGELSVRKNQQIIIRAIAQLPDKERYVFVICGRAVINSTVEHDLRQIADDLNVRVCLIGHRLDIPQINVCADIAVIPSLREGFGLAGVEALASGVPVIGSDVQGIREYVIPGRTGYLCDPCNEQEFAEAIEKISRLNECSRRSMSEECRKKAREFDIDISKKTMEKIYQQVLGI